MAKYNIYIHYEGHCVLSEENVELSDYEANHRRLYNDEVLELIEE